MARGRIISRSISTSRKFAALAEEAGKLGEFAQTLYLLLTPHADDFGRLEGDLFTIKHLILPASERSERDFEHALEAMAKVGLTDWYEVAGQRFVAIVGFDQHQTGLHKRTKSRFPDPPGDSGNFPETPSEQNGREENRREGNGTGIEAAEAAGPVKFTSEGSPAADELLELWRTICVPAGLPDVRKFDEQLRRKCLTRLSQEPNLETWREVFRKVAASTFCRGEGAPSKPGEKAWRADFRWVVESESNHAKVLEGKYDDRIQAAAGGFVG